jgi:hypothetical protein
VAITSHNRTPGSRLRTARPRLIVLGRDEGAWKEEADAAVIKWDTGWTTKITKECDKYKNTAYDEGKPQDGPPSNSSEAEKVG